jgi:hypothetical protein
MNLRTNFRASLFGSVLVGYIAVGCGPSGSAISGSAQGSGGNVATAGNTSVGGNGDNVGGAGTTATGGLATAGGAGGAGTSTGGARPTGGAAPGGSKATGGSPATGGTPGTGGTPIITCNSNVTSVGCTPGQLSQTGTLAGPFQTYNATIGNKQYFFQVNEWNSTATQSLSYGGSLFFKMTTQQATVSSSGGPAGYPSVFIGANSNHTTSGSGMPKQVSALGTVLTTWNWADNGNIASSSSIFNAAYDVWFSTNAAGEPSAAGPSGGYLMVWYHAQGCQPIGTVAEAGHTIAGVPGCWDVWTGTNGGRPVISYKHQGPVQSLGFDLNLFIKDALANYPNYMKSNWYLTNIFSGFEIWSGGVNLQSTSFCAEVN